MPLKVLIVGAKYIRFKTIKGMHTLYFREFKKQR